MTGRVSINRKLVYISQPQWMIGHWCPGCSTIHGFPCFEPTWGGSKWEFDGDYKLPSFLPSIEFTGYDKVKDEHKKCHYILAKGKISYLSGTTHHLKGQVVPLPDIPHKEFNKHCMRELNNGFRRFNGDNYEA